MFGFFRKKEDEAETATKAHMGQKNDFYFCETRKRWVQSGKEDEIDEAEGVAPPPMMGLPAPKRENAPKTEVYNPLQRILDKKARAKKVVINGLPNTGRDPGMMRRPEAAPIVSRTSPFSSGPTVSHTPTNDVIVASVSAINPQFGGTTQPIPEDGEMGQERPDVDAGGGALRNFEDGGDAALKNFEDGGGGLRNFEDYNPEDG